MFTLSIPEMTSLRVMPGSFLQPMAWQRKLLLNLNVVGVLSEVILGVHLSEEYSISGESHVLETYGGRKIVTWMSSVVLVRVAIVPRPVRSVLLRRPRRTQTGLVRHPTTSLDAVLMRTSPMTPKRALLNGSLGSFLIMVNVNRQNWCDTHRYPSMSTSMRLRCSNLRKGQGACDQCHSLTHY